MTDPTDPTASNGPSPPGWVAFADAAAAADVTHAVLAAALADGDVSFTTRLAGPEMRP